MEELLNNGVICPIPWIHLSMFPDGKTLICPCQSDYSVTLGNYFTDKVSDMINHEKLKTLRKDMLNGNSNPICSHCYYYENKDPNKNSSRTTFLKRFGKNLEKGILNTSETGFLDPDSFDFAYWDVRISNLCNLKCRTCHPYLSSSVQNEYKKLGWHIEPKKTYRIEKVENSKNFIREISKHIDKVEEIHFAGGEPMLMQEHWSILDELVLNKRFNVKLHYQTNLMKLDYKNKSVFDYWEKFEENLLICPSIDAVGNKLGYIRSGSDWNNFKINLQRLLDFKNKVKNLNIIPTITISVFNVLYFCDLINYLCSKNIRSYKFNIVRNPNYYNASLLPAGLKKVAMKKISECEIKNNFSSNFFGLIKNEIYIEEFDKEKSDLQEIFKEKTNILDCVRNEKFNILFRELKSMLNQ
jgi:uncharacterized Fe-S cluster-containing radical SAM superfamily protein